MSKQRPIEFRFWSKGTSENLNFQEKRFWTLPCYLLEKYFSFPDLVASKDFVAQQFTGLLDKNGKKIFEGDVLEIVVDDESYIDIIVFVDGAFGTTTRQVFTPFCKTPEYMAICSVIGNIFENPELIKK